MCIISEICIVDILMRIQVDISNLFLSMLNIVNDLETECRLFPPVTIFLDLFPCAGYFFNAFD